MVSGECILWVKKSMYIGIKHRGKVVICLSVCSSTYLFVYLSILISIYLSIYLFVNLSFYLDACSAAFPTMGITIVERNTPDTW